MVRWAFAAAAGGFFVWRWLHFRAARARAAALIAAGAPVVDVRSPEEFAAGCRPGSLNIPLGRLAAECGRLDKDKPVVVCCASGSRSAAAAGILKAKGFRLVVNAGPWTNTLP
ncbi:MAG: rhodanese-like domain-containing protein [Elusimicrobia bacterium]|nr:rhodanese-like domain-containing protein [Elusimicrobiota bacterium]